MRRLVVCVVVVHAAEMQRFLVVSVKCHLASVLLLHLLPAQLPRAHTTRLLLTRMSV